MDRVFFWALNANDDRGKKLPISIVKRNYTVNSKNGDESKLKSEENKKEIDKVSTITPIAVEKKMLKITEQRKNLSMPMVFTKIEQQSDDLVSRYKRQSMNDQNDVTNWKPKISILQRWLLWMSEKKKSDGRKKKSGFDKDYGYSYRSNDINDSSVRLPPLERIDDETLIDRGYTVPSRRRRRRRRPANEDDDKTTLRKRLPRRKRDEPSRRVESKNQLSSARNEINTDFKEMTSKNHLDYDKSSGKNKDLKSSTQKSDEKKKKD